jgi:hypothetical protein
MRKKLTPPPTPPPVTTPRLPLPVLTPPPPPSSERGALPPYMERAGQLLSRDIELIHNLILAILLDPTDRSRHHLLVKLIDRIYPHVGITDRSPAAAQTVAIQIVGATEAQTRLVTVPPDEEPDE